MSIMPAVRLTAKQKRALVIAGAAFALLVLLAAIFGAPVASFVYATGA